eukprot:PhF_6_TR43383/c1_g1_i8/m.66570
MRDKRFLKKHKWTCLVVDEAHRLKNFNCKLIKDLKELKTDNRVLLTGTPLQNKLSELWSILNFVMPDVFNALESFSTWFEVDNLDDYAGAGERAGTEDDDHDGEDNCLATTVLHS